jgi:hypothetical protein
MCGIDVSAAIACIIKEWFRDFIVYIN